MKVSHVLLAVLFLACGDATEGERGDLRTQAERGDEKAQARLGLKYLDGDGVDQDPQKAIRWFRMAARQGDISTQTRLRTMYFEGWGVERDYVEAHAWFNLASAGGAVVARHARDLLAEEMTADEIAKAEALARRMWSRQQKEREPSGP